MFAPRGVFAARLVVVSVPLWKGQVDPSLIAVSDCCTLAGSRRNQITKQRQGMRELVFSKHESGLASRFFLD